MWTDRILALQEKPISREMLHCYACLPSTNDTAKEMAAAGAPAGTVVIADRQTQGRGRMGRSFHSPAGTGIYLSRLLRPDRSPAQLMHLTCAVAVTACDAIQKVSGFRPDIKWVNDLITKGKKLGGILTEMSLNPDGSVKYCIVGIGINCNHAPMPPELQDIAISLEAVTGRKIDRDAVIAALLDAFTEMDKRLTDSTYWLERYRASCITVGKQIRVLAPQPYPAEARDIDANGGLVIRLPDGTEQTLTAGEVSIRGMYDDPV